LRIFKYFFMKQIKFIIQLFLIKIILKFFIPVMPALKNRQILQMN